MAEIVSSPDFAIIQQIPIDKIRPSSHQVRKDFDADSIKRLADSIAKEGLIQPITVRRIGEIYELIAGERRFRAAKSLGHSYIDARVIEVPSEAAASAKGLVENLQREDLNPIEEAEGFYALNQMDPKYWDQSQIAGISGRSQEYVSLSLKLLGLPSPVLDSIRQRILSRSHGLELLRLKDSDSQISIAKRMEGLNRAQARELVDKSIGKLNYQSSGTHNSENLDPVRSLWPQILSHKAIDASGGWVVAYKKQHWNFSVSSEAVPNLHSLANWFKQMGEVLSMAAPQNSETSDPRQSRIKEPADLMPTSTEELEQMVKEQYNLRLPKTPEEEAELVALVPQGPRAIYAWIYGPDSLLAKKVAASTWDDFGLTDPQEGLKKLIDGMRKIQAGEHE